MTKLPHQKRRAQLQEQMLVWLLVCIPQTLQSNSATRCLNVLFLHHSNMHVLMYLARIARDAIYNQNLLEAVDSTMAEAATFLTL